MADNPSQFRGTAIHNPEFSYKLTIPTKGNFMTRATTRKAWCFMFPVFMLYVSSAVADGDHGSMVSPSQSAPASDIMEMLQDMESTLDIDAQLQVRYNSRSSSDEEGSESGFENRRAKLKFNGTVGENWEWEITAAYNRDDGINGDRGGEVEDAYIGYVFDSGMELIAGQFKAPLLREERVSSSRQLAAERSLINSYFTTGRVSGMELSRSYDRLRWAFSFNDGVESANTGYDLDKVDMGVTSRVEFLLGGNALGSTTADSASTDWSDFKGFTSTPGSSDGMMVGAATHYQNGNGDVVDDLVTMTVDASMRADGGHAFIAFMMMEDGADKESTGFIGQVGFYVSPELEGFLRYEMGQIRGSTADDLSIITAGINKYFPEKKAKFTLDCGLGIEPVTAQWSQSGGAWASDTTSDGQTVLRAQWQLLF